MNSKSEIGAETRPPIIVVMGHIDHGKTTLLDKIRNSNVAEKETGGITQHIGAYKIQTERGGITFIDTPGHEAFSKMRSRGARVADIALLVVAGDDGVKPQTEEALKVINEANLPFIVVINKIDRENSDPEKAKKELGDKGVIFEEWGGKVPVVKVSAKTGQGIPELLEMILLLAEIDGLTYDSSKSAEGVVIEAHLDSQRGQSATLLLRDGQLKKGDWILAGDAKVKTKILEDYRGEPVNNALASDPVRVVGFDKSVKAGAVFKSFNSKEELDDLLKSSQAQASLRTPYQEGEKVVPIILKADVSGSLEAIEGQIARIDLSDYSLAILRSEVGTITEDDIKLASGNKNSLVIGFRVKIDKAAIATAERFGVTVMNFNIIYELEDWIKKELERIIGEEKVRKILGVVRIIKIFKETGSKKIVGGVVESGGIYSQKRFTLLRRNFPLGEGKISELQAGKIKVNEILSGNEFGALVEIAIEVVQGDRLEIFDEESVWRNLTKI
ncbi:translation initiation factor IF-2 [Candidatus Giovannonibacteria bacterium]|nr:translation initiation factor IF-2 [Candidatus Giovannonibacteria bacterium]